MGIFRFGEAFCLFTFFFFFNFFYFKFCKIKCVSIFEIQKQIQIELVLNFWILIMLRFALRALSLILCRKGSYLENFEIIIFLIMLEKILFRLLLFLIEIWPKRRFQVNLLDFLQWLYQTLTNLQSSKKLCFVDKILFSIVL